MACNDYFLKTFTNLQQTRQGNREHKNDDEKMGYSSACAYSLRVHKEYKNLRQSGGYLNKTQIIKDLKAVA